RAVRLFRLQTARFSSPASLVAMDTSLPKLPDGTTTLMVCNLPAKYDKEMLLKIWKPDGSYDMLHVPLDPETQRSKGFCFLNFVSHEKALAFQWLYHHTRLKLQRGKRLRIVAAETQGLPGNMARFQRKQNFLSPAAFPVLLWGRHCLNNQEVRNALAMSQAGPGVRLMRLSL
ncbi:hypothetical protein EBZ37_13805, partial [bacterium]|nr:hypothetical protein [bacterium]